MACKHCHKEGGPKKKGMTVAARKAKGRRLQQRVRDDLRALAGTRLDPTDIESTIMGCNGVDVILSKAARDLFGELAIECKNVEVLNAVGVFQKHWDKYAPQGKIPIMVHSRNYVEPRVTMLWSDFVTLYLSKVVQPKHPPQAIPGREGYHDVPQVGSLDGTKCPHCKHPVHPKGDCSERVTDAAGDVDYCPCQLGFSHTPTQGEVQ